ncbi:S1 RNA-binding domain-containing protein [uncultured Clostridium sp.]|uniref:CvfB family protein n=1 Tax=uncultured Clostridium sp. TaxID=59620 RepID=UPI00260A7E5A|nr:S1-like domain-containing RNA-binding protein [uncultured Clostridium sp.]
MIKIGDYNKLEVVRQSAFGMFLGAKTSSTDDDILIPNNNILTNDVKIGDEIEAFIYRDSADRLIATEKKPLAVVGDLAVLTIKELNEKIGAFADLGLERDILIPFKEQKYTLEVGKSYLLYIYVDKTGRLAATTDVDRDLDYMEDAELNAEATGIIYGFQTNGSLSIAIDNKYKGAVLTKEFYENFKIGDTVTGTISRIYEDGIVTLRLRAKKLEEKGKLETEILEYLKNNGGQMKLYDKSSPEAIKDVFKCSKKYFKMSLGGLMRAKLITQDETGTKLIVQGETELV